MVQKPVLKWAGNKLPILERVLDVLPAGERLVEPFVGSGAIFLNTKYPSYLLSDASRDLMLMYLVMLDFPEYFDAEIDNLFTPENNTKENYYSHRKEFNSLSEYSNKRAPLFVYLNRHCFNGLCRFSEKSGFNVPFGRYKKPYCPREEVIAFRKKAVKANRDFGDFEYVVRENSRTGDVIYLDPPYAPASDTADFANYTSDGFGPDDQRRLVKLAEDMQGKGIPVIVSNHDTPYTRDLYKSSSLIKSFEVQRFISAKAEGRTMAKELLACYYP